MGNNILAHSKHINDVRISTPKGEESQSDQKRPENIQSDDYNCTTFSRIEDSLVSAP